jgi:glyoxylase-like metal-dependent hydrolase (beta-lactamase superfamily II)
LASIDRNETPPPSHYGPVTVLFGRGGGRYPDGNSVLVQGERETILIDPSVGVADGNYALPEIDRVLNSHCHEDHIAGNFRFPDASWHFHEDDLQGIHSIENLIAFYGYEGKAAEAFYPLLTTRFHYTPRSDAVAFGEGDVFDLGGVIVRVVHTPGHTRGHCCFMIEWPDEDRGRRFLYLGDIELTGFGPYYGDACSSLVDFERSLELIASLEADWYGTFHHIGVLEEDAYRERLGRFAGMIENREQRLLDYLAEPRSYEEVVAHRFVFRPGDDLPYAEPAERRSMRMHLDRLLEAGAIRQAEDERYVVA